MVATERFSWLARARAYTHALTSTESEFGFTHNAYLIQSDTRGDGGEADAPGTSADVAVHVTIREWATSRTETMGSMNTAGLIAHSSTGGELRCGFSPIGTWFLLRHKTALMLLKTYDTISLEDLRVANMVRNHHLAKSISDASWAAFRTILEGKAAYALAVESSPCHPPTPARIAAVAGNACVRVSVCTPISACAVGWSWTATRTPRSTFCGPGRPVRR